jgi:hypothetical protein
MTSNSPALIPAAPDSKTLRIVAMKAPGMAKSTICVMKETVLIGWAFTNSAFLWRKLVSQAMTRSIRVVLVVVVFIFCCFSSKESSLMQEYGFQCGIVFTVLRFDVDGLGIN